MTCNWSKPLQNVLSVRPSMKIWPGNDSQLTRAPVTNVSVFKCVRSLISQANHLYMRWILRNIREKANKPSLHLLPSHSWGFQTFLSDFSSLEVWNLNPSYNKMQHEGNKTILLLIYYYWSSSVLSLIFSPFFRQSFLPFGRKTAFFFWKMFLLFSFV